MIRKLVEHYSAKYDVYYPGNRELMDKLNEIIDYLNSNEKTCAELIAEHEKKPVELIIDNIIQHQSDFSDME